jgi:hypothetical protein
MKSIIFMGDVKTYEKTKNGYQDNTKN